MGVATGLLGWIPILVSFCSCAVTGLAIPEFAPVSCSASSVQLLGSLGNAPCLCVLGLLYVLTSSLPLLQDLLVGNPISEPCTLHHSLKPHRGEPTLDAALKEDRLFCNPPRTPMPLHCPLCSFQLAPLKHGACVFIDHTCRAAPTLFRWHCFSDHHERHHLRGRNYVW